jgi:hypothetical protein
LIGLSRGTLKQAKGACLNQPYKKQRSPELKQNLKAKEKLQKPRAREEHKNKDKVREKKARMEKTPEEKGGRKERKKNVGFRTKNKSMG